MPVKTFMQIFLWPILMGVLTIVGLVATLLLDDGWLEMMTVSALGIPVMVMMYIYLFKRHV
jgi:hypothetical protein